MEPKTFPLVLALCVLEKGVTIGPLIVDAAVDDDKKSETAKYSNEIEIKRVCVVKNPSLLNASQWRRSQQQWSMVVPLHVP
jgi:hypothetical protein